MKITENTIEFGDPDSFDAYVIEHSLDEAGDPYIAISDPFDEYVVLSTEAIVRKCIEALEESLRFGWVK